ncbi:MAG: hypothetical protein GY718_14425 [Lentisphaerae bacterium]|nr:hypothetical protein [Lentisphaerota bacterium]
MFEQASRLKLRFNYKGVHSTEDLWEMPLEALDTLFKELNAQMKTQEEESLLETRSNEDKILALKIGIIKHVVETRLREQKVRENEVEKATKKQKLLGIIAEKQDASLHDMSVEDLAKLIDEL